MMPNRQPAAAPLRKDARDNLAKLTAAATAIFQERGLGAPLEDIARRAGVSTGTLYNRFGSREALIDAVIQDLASERLATAAADAEAEGESWDRFAAYVLQLCELQATCPALNDVISRKYPGAHELAAICDAALGRAASFIADAQREGVLRADFTAADLVLIFTANASVVAATQDLAPEAWRRMVAYLLDGLRADAARPLAAPLSRSTIKP